MAEEMYTGSLLVGIREPTVNLFSQSRVRTSSPGANGRAIL